MGGSSAVYLGITSLCFRAKSTRPSLHISLILWLAGSLLVYACNKSSFCLYATRTDKGSSYQTTPGQPFSRLL